MAFRPRKEIEDKMYTIFKMAAPAQAMPTFHMLTLEVLLDIRDSLVLLGRTLTDPSKSSEKSQEDPL